MKTGRHLFACVLLLIILLAGCNIPEEPTSVPITEENPITDPPTATTESTAEPDPTDTLEPTEEPMATLEPVETQEPEVFPGYELEGVGFATPESVLYDPEADVYLVSNINGGPSAEDDNGFISRISPDGEILALKWIDGAADEVDLDAPKGMALAGDNLYVADINDVRVFDCETGAPLETIPFPGAKFLNDMTDDDGMGVYVSDGGDNTVYTFGASGAMGDFAVTGVNGVAMLAGQFYATSGSQIVKTSVEGTVTVYELPAGSLDGLVLLPDGSALVSSWQGEAVYYAQPDGTVETLFTGPAMADIGYDALRHRILIPRFNNNAVAVLPLVDLVPLP